MYVIHALYKLIGRMYTTLGILCGDSTRYTFLPLACIGIGSSTHEYELPGVEKRYLVPFLHCSGRLLVPEMALHHRQSGAPLLA
jgi:hypothetical protein